MRALGLNFSFPNTGTHFWDVKGREEERFLILPSRRDAALIIPPLRLPKASLAANLCLTFAPAESLHPGGPGAELAGNREGKTGVWSGETLDFFLKPPLCGAAVVMGFLNALAEVNLAQTASTHGLILV